MNQTEMDYYFKKEISYHDSFMKKERERTANTE
jgi:hypothetical protein